MTKTHKQKREEDFLQRMREKKKQEEQVTHILKKLLSWSSSIDRTDVYNKDSDFSIELAIKDRDTSFADLEELSNIFKTKDINLDSEAREEGWCDTCRYSTSAHIVKVATTKELIEELYRSTSET